MNQHETETNGNTDDGDTVRKTLYSPRGQSDRLKGKKYNSYNKVGSLSSHVPSNCTEQQESALYSTIEDMDGMEVEGYSQLDQTSGYDACEEYSLPKIVNLKREDGKQVASAPVDVGYIPNVTKPTKNLSDSDSIIRQRRENVGDPTNTSDDLCIVPSTTCIVNTSQFEKDGNKRSHVLSALRLLLYLLAVANFSVSVVLFTEYKLSGGLLEAQDGVDVNIQDLKKAMSDFHTCGSQETPILRVLDNMTCYCVQAKPLSWSDARDSCMRRSREHFLAEPMDNRSNSFLLGMMRAIGARSGYWIGGSKLNKDSEWMWSRSQIKIESPFWDVGEPSDADPYGETEQCLEVWNWSNRSGPFKFNSAVCRLERYPVCQSTMTYYKNDCTC